MSCSDLRSDCSIARSHPLAVSLYFTQGGSEGSEGDQERCPARCAAPGAVRRIARSDPDRDLVLVPRFVLCTMLTLLTLHLAASSMDMSTVAGNGTSGSDSGMVSPPLQRQLCPSRFRVALTSSLPAGLVPVVAAAPRWPALLHRVGRQLHQQLAVRGPLQGAVHQPGEEGAAPPPPNRRCSSVARCHVRCCHVRCCQ